MRPLPMRPQLGVRQPRCACRGEEGCVATTEQASKTAPSWTLAQLLQHSLLLHDMRTGVVALPAVAASVMGAFAASAGQGNMGLQEPSARDLLRTLFGGFLMGVGISLIPGGNDGLILSAVPALSPGGFAAVLTMTATILIGLIGRRRLTRGGRIDH